MKKPIIVALVLAVVAMGVLPVAFLLMAMMLVSSGAANYCVEENAVAVAVGGPVRVPIAGNWSTTSEWGLRKHPIRGGYSHHYGLDFGGATTIVAAQGGVVSATPTTGGEGNEVVIDHGGGTKTKYKHLTSRAVATGDQVSAGKKIGMMGSTGAWSTGRHLHFEVWVEGKDINPRSWFKTHGVTVGKSGKSTKSPTDPGDLAALSTQVIDRTTVKSGKTGTVVSPLPAKVGTWKGVQVQNAAHVIRAGQAMGLDSWTITVGVMTAIGESTLIVVDHGDSAGPDSRGLFQQRAGGAWGSYSARMDPTTSATNFFKALVKVPGYKQLAPTIAAHRTQRNADKYHYAKHWKPAHQLVSALTGDSSLQGVLADGQALEGCENPGIDSNFGDGSGEAIVAAAKKFLGTPYSWGGGTTEGPGLGIRTSAALDGSKTVGFDCSSLVLYAVHQATGLTLPRTAGAQGLDRRGTTIKRDYDLLQPGDVIAFSSTGSRRPGAFEHIGIYAGNGQMIHAPRPGKNVEIVKLKGNRYYERQTWAIKRFGGDAGARRVAS